MGIFAEHAFLGDGWQRNVRVTTQAGRITHVTPEAAPQAGDERVAILLPGLPNLHSHTFQRAMAGMTEQRGETSDSFWTWRDLMYRFLDHLTPDDIEAIAAFAFMEMLETGFTSVAEFHYVHHQPGGKPYDDVSETSQRIRAAATTTGLGLTLLPVLYSYAGISRAPLSGGQLRFRNDLDSFERLFDAASASMTEDIRMGVAPHSLRAVDDAQLRSLAQSHADGPIHIHIAEQEREVAEVLKGLGTRPVQWLMEHVDVGPYWCLIHATHMQFNETLAVAQSGAVAGLCPITEANLGDGVFDGARFLQAGGRFGVGTDSNVRISLPGELSMLEYSQRLTEKQRNVMAAPLSSTGQTLFSKALQGGAQALGRDCGTIAVGQWADLVALDADDPSLACLPSSQWLDAWLFASTKPLVKHAWSAGRHVVKHNRHIAQEQITAKYFRVLKDLMARL